MPENAQEKATTTRIGDRLEEAARAAFVGRRSELEQLGRSLFEEGAQLVFVHGIGGIGKSTLLDAFVREVSGPDCRVIRFDGHEVEPTPRGMLEAIGAALDAQISDVEDAGRALDALPEEHVLLAIDEYDGLRLLDGWLRRTLVPGLPARVRILFAGRNRPMAAWTATPGWDALVRSHELGPLQPEDADRLLARQKLSDGALERVRRIGAGHPLTLKLAAAAAVARPDLPLAEMELRHVVAELVRRFLGDVQDPRERAAVEAASVLRRVTRPLLACMMGEGDVEPAMETLRRLPFVETAPDGLVVHQSVRSAVSAELRAIDPERHRTLRSRAFRHLEAEIHEAPRARRWQITADILHLLDQFEAIREAIFPSDTIRFGLEAARASDRGAIEAIARAHLAPSEADALVAWWEHLPSAFQVARGEHHRVAAFYVLALASDVPEALVEADPVLGVWMRDLASARGAGGRPVLLNRAILSAETGEAPSDERACCFIDIKRAYMENLDLASICVAVHRADEFGVFEHIGFRHLPDLAVPAVEGAGTETLVLDFGAGVLEWIGRLIESRRGPVESLVASGRGFALDRDTRELVVDGERRRLTRLEYGLLAYLEDRGGAVASRDELLESVWGQTHTGSNVVDAVIRSVRKKLGAHAAAVETVTGFGYKLRPR